MWRQLTAARSRSRRPAMLPPPRMQAGAPFISRRSPAPPATCLHQIKGEDHEQTTESPGCAAHRCRIERGGAHSFPPGCSEQDAGGCHLPRYLERGAPGIFGACLCQAHRCHGDAIHSARERSALPPHGRQGRKATVRRRTVRYPAGARRGEAWPHRGIPCGQVAQLQGPAAGVSG